MILQLHWTLLILSTVSYMGDLAWHVLPYISLNQIGIVHWRYTFHLLFSLVVVGVDIFRVTSGGFYIKLHLRVNVMMGLIVCIMYYVCIMYVCIHLHVVCVYVCVCVDYWLFTDKIWNRMRPRVPVQNQQTKEVISTQKTSHKHNNKDLQ